MKYHDTYFRGRSVQFVNGVWDLATNRTKPAWTTEYESIKLAKHKLKKIMQVCIK